MKPKRRNVCQECRSRKLACDGKLPACSQCTLRRVPCTGYSQEFQFVSSFSTTRKQTKVKDWSKTTSTIQKFVPTNSGHNAGLIRGCQVAQRVWEPVILEPTKHQSLEDDIHYIVQHYTPLSGCDPAEFNPSHNQICGAWVEVLPLFSTTAEKKPFLFFAIKTLGTSLRCLRPTCKLSRSHALDLYCKSLGLMSEALKDTPDVFHVEHCVAIMCLAVSDIMNPDLGSSWAAHLNGLRDWMENLGPEAFSSGNLRTLFIGIRPLLLMTSILSRQMTFLAQEVWMTTSFRGRTPSMVQQLLNQGSKIPGLLERFDITRGSVEQVGFAAIETLCQEFRNAMRSLQEWESKQSLQAASPLFWTRPPSKSSAPSHARDLWFPNLMVANSLTHCWAFKIVAKSHIDMLETTLAAQNKDNPEWALHRPSGPSTETSIAHLARMICDSMTYLLQPETKLFGPTSIFFTLLTAIEVFKRDPYEHRAQISRCQQIVARLAAIGIQTPRIQV